MPDSTAYSVVKVIGFLLMSGLISALYDRHKESKPNKAVEPDCSHLPPFREITEPSVIDKGLWAILGIAPTDDPREVKRAYRKLAHEFHPDKHAGDKRKEERLKEINEAYRQIMAGL